MGVRAFRGAGSLTPHYSGTLTPHYSGTFTPHYAGTFTPHYSPHPRREPIALPERITC